MKRSPMKRTRMVRRVTERAAAYRDELEQVRPLVVARAMGLCELCRAEPGTTIHHRKLRSQGGTNSLANLMFLSDECHSWTHDHPATSYARGLLLRREDAEVEYEGSGW
jgi:5-methylcytosine-specific restriction endonuclease McrA